MASREEAIALWRKVAQTKPEHRDRAAAELQKLGASVEDAPPSNAPPPEGIRRGDYANPVMGPHYESANTTMVDPEGAAFFGGTKDEAREALGTAAGAYTGIVGSGATGGVVKEGLKRVATPALKKVGTVAGNLLDDAVGAFTGGTTYGAITHQDPAKAVDEGVDAIPGSMAIGAGARAVGSVADAVIDGVKAMRARNPSVQFIESRGGTVSAGTPGKGGPFDDPLVAKGIDKGSGRVTEAGIGKVRRAGAREVGSFVKGREAAVKGQFHGDAPARGSGEMVDITDVYDEAMRMTKDVDLPSNVRATIYREIVGDFMNQADDSGKMVAELVDDGAGGQRILMPAERANALKRKIQYFAEFSAEGKAEPNFARLSSEAQAPLEGTEIAARNKAFKQAADEVEELRGAVGLKKKFDAPITRAQEKTVGVQLGRMGQDTVAAGADMTPELEAAIAKHRELRRLYEAIPALRARSALEFKGPGSLPTGGLYEKFKGLLSANVDPTLVRILAPLTTDTAGVVSGAATGAGALAPSIATVLDPAGAALEEGRRKRKQKQERK